MFNVNNFLKKKFWLFIYLFFRNNFDIKDNETILFEYGTGGKNQSKTRGFQQTSEV